MLSNVHMNLPMNLPKVVLHTLTCRYIHLLADTCTYIHLHADTYTYMQIHALTYTYILIVCNYIKI